MIGLLVKGQLVTGIVIDAKSESFAATLDQNFETWGQFHIMCWKVPETFKEQNVHDESAINFIQCSVNEVKIDLLMIWVKWGLFIVHPDLWPIKIYGQFGAVTPPEENYKVQALYLCFYFEWQVIYILSE